MAVVADTVVIGVNIVASVYAIIRVSVDSMVSSVSEYQSGNGENGDY